MSTVYFQGSPCTVYGKFPAAGDKAPGFCLIGTSLNEIRPQDYEGKRIVLNIFPSLDTPVCAASVRRFNQEAAGIADTVVLCVSMDLPFAQARFCTVNGIENVVPASAFRSPEFGQHYGVTITDGPLAGLLARAVVVIDKDRQVIYSQLVDEITHEPDYEAAISALK